MNRVTRRKRRPPPAPPQAAGGADRGRADDEGAHALGQEDQAEPPVRDVERAVDAILAVNKKLVLMQCNTNYTGSLENFGHIDLNALKQFAAMYPEACIALMLPQPVGGFRWISKMRGLFDAHIDYVIEHGLQGTLDFALKERTVFQEDGRGGPWGTAVGNEPL